MNKPELIAKIADKTNSTKKASEAFLDSLVDSIFEGLQEDGKVNIPGFGIFEIKESKERIGRNPRTGEEIKIEARKSVSFKANKALKANIDQE